MGVNRNFDKLTNYSVIGQVLKVNFWLVRKSLLNDLIFTRLHLTACSHFSLSSADSQNILLNCATFFLYPGRLWHQGAINTGLVRLSIPLTVAESRSRGSKVANEKVKTVENACLITSMTESERSKLKKMK